MSERRRLKPVDVLFEQRTDDGVYWAFFRGPNGMPTALLKKDIDAISEPLPDPRRERIVRALTSQGCAPSYRHTFADAILAALDEEPL